MLFYFLHPHHPAKTPEEHPVVRFHDAPRNTSEGGEFIDDAIHMEDALYMPTEESVATGSPDRLL